ncbi:MAG: nucleotidyltransferase family protein [Cellulomonas sp.]
MPSTRAPHLTGIVLAAGAGRRRGEPKALAAGPDGPWLAEAVRLLLVSGCERVVAVLGAGADDARALLPEDDRVVAVVAEGWSDGIGESLRTGLAHAAGDAALITLVDLPGTPVSVVERVLAADGDLRQAVYDGRPGHPVLVGRSHWAPLSRVLTGDRGARAYLTEHGVTEVECGDLHHGLDRDT